LAIFREPDSIDELFKACPLRFTLERVQDWKEEAPEEQEQSLPEEGPRDIEDEITAGTTSHDHSRIDGAELLRRPSTLINQPLIRPSLHDEHQKPSPSPSAPGDESEPPVRIEFRISADKWQGKHADYLERSPFWGPFVVDTRSRIQQDLKQRAPLFGLTDLGLQRREIPLRVLRKQQEELASRMTVREYFELAKTSEEGLLDSPTDPAEESLDQTPAAATSHSLLRRLKQPKRPLAFAQPPNPYNATREEKVEIARERRNKKSVEERQIDMLPHTDSPKRMLSNGDAQYSSSQFQPKQRSNSQYGSLRGAANTRRTDDGNQIYDSVADSFSMAEDPNVRRTPRPSGDFWSSFPGGDMGFGASGGQYGSLMESGSKQKKKKRGSGVHDDAAEIEAELRRGVL